MDCDANKPLCKAQGIGAFPVLVKYNQANMKGSFWQGKVFEQGTGVEALYSFATAGTKKPVGDIVHLDSAKFASAEEDDRVWVIEFSSARCGSCKEFKPEWEDLAKSLKRCNVGHVDVDDKAGMALAEKLGVMEEGIPAVKVLKGGALATLMAGGELSSAKGLRRALKPLLKGLKKDADGFFLKGGAQVCTTKE